MPPTHTPHGAVPPTHPPYEAVPPTHPPHDILGATFDSKLTFETHLRNVMSKTARRLRVVRRAGKLFDCSRVLKACFNAYVLSNLEYHAPVWMSSAESHLSFLDSVVRSAEILCEGELRWLGHRRKEGHLVSAL